MFDNVDCVICSDRGFKRVIAREYHCLAYTENSIYAWGTNVGQFGMHTNDAKVFQPKKVNEVYVLKSNASLYQLLIGFSWKHFHIRSILLIQVMQPLFA